MSRQALASVTPFEPESGDVCATREGGPGMRVRLTAKSQETTGFRRRIRVGPLPAGIISPMSGSIFLASLAATQLRAGRPQDSRPEVGATQCSSRLGF